MERRTRVKGSGPSRELLKTFYKLGEVSSATVEELNTVLNTNPNNDIGGDSYAISNTIDCAISHNMIETKYRQVLLQKLNGGPYDSEFSYTQWDTNYQLSNTINDIKKHFNNVSRFRLSETQANHEIAWHIDTNTSVACRAQICVTDDDSVFEFKDREGIHQLRMKPGELWFINTGWNHRVVAGSKVRRVAIFTFVFDDLIDKDILYK